MKELAVISGKGGTGKTSVVAAFAALAPDAVLADCDVDAADLHLVLGPEIREEGPFSGGSLASVKAEFCTSCGTCHSLCRFGAVVPPATDGGPYSIDELHCEGCSVCYEHCPAGAISFEESVNGRWFVSGTRFGPMAHARLGIAEENSGKLAALVRDKATGLAEEAGSRLIIIDGAPGIGCPVISSITGVSYILVVTEPTLSGFHDLERVIQLSKHFRIPVAVTVNKCDINEEIANEIEEKSGEFGVSFAGRVRYDSSITKAQIAGVSITEYSRDNPGDAGAAGAAKDVEAVWKYVESELFGQTV